MKLKFKTQAHQTAAVQAVVDCFKGQPLGTSEAISYRLDPGKGRKSMGDLFAEDGFKNADLKLTDALLLDNINQVQHQQNLPRSAALAKSKVSRVNLDIEMETGTGKTYCYIKTIFELNKQYGWSKFIIVVPSIAIREGVAKSLDITAEHFLETYHKKARFFIYNSKQLHQLESFSSDAGINVMVINVQAFAARGADNRRIYDVLDDFQSRRPIDVISANRPVLILDEPQKMEGAQTQKSLEEFKALMVLRYSATHKTAHNKIHRLDALDAYNQKLVKRIAVRGISVKGLAGTNAYLYLQSIEISTTKLPEARVEFERKEANGIRRVVRKLSKGSNLFEASNGLGQYQGYVVADIDANTDTLRFTNGVELFVGEAIGDMNEATLRRIQIREAIKAHFDKEEALFQKGIKVLSLFFIDEVVKYRDYAAADEKGEYARVFEDEYNQYLNEVLDLDETPYIKYLKGIDPSRTHRGYFSVDKKTRRLVDPALGKKATETDDVDAYDLILKHKERLLSFEEPVRFIFSHSALREGWDNPNVFVICALKHSDNTVSRRQEVGRGLRLSVNQSGDRMDQLSTVHDVNVLTVVASESYKDFVAALQKDISESLADRPRVADEAYFTGKVLRTPAGDVDVTPQLAKMIYKYLLKNDYSDDGDRITAAYHEARKNGSLAPLPPELQAYGEQVYQLIDSVFSDALKLDIENDRRPKKNPLNSNFDKPEFRELWNRINGKAAYNVRFDAQELVKRAVAALCDKDKGLHVTPLQYIVQKGEQLDQVTHDALKSGDSFRLRDTDVERNEKSVLSTVKYDLIGKIAEGTQLTRRTVADILKGINLAVMGQFRMNPESFIMEAIRLINEQKAAMVVAHLSYVPIDDKYDLDIFTTGQTKQDFSKAGAPLERHIYDYVITDSNIEREFVKQLDTCTDVVAYAKLPRDFLISTPAGDYNPDWAIVFKEEAVKHVYVVAETKGSMSSTVLNEIEKAKIECAHKFFDEMNRSHAGESVKYEVVDTFERLMELVK